MKKLPITLERLKQQAKALSKSSNIKHAEALHIVAQQHHFPNWKAVLRLHDDIRLSSIKAPEVSKKFLTAKDVFLTDEDKALVERFEDLPEATSFLVSKNRAYFSSIGIEYAIFEPTVTGLKKNILDATGPVRTLFEIEEFHDFSRQGQGVVHRKRKPAFFVDGSNLLTSRVSLYRPVTKMGDPRMWFSGLPNFASATEQIAIVVFDGSLYLFNFSKFDLERELGYPAKDESNLVEEQKAEKGKAFEVLRLYLQAKNEVSSNLLARLREIAKKPIRAEQSGDTAVGMAVEKALGIVANSNKAPDFEGKIEIKSGRASKNRTTLFAQVPDWNNPISECKSSAAILDRYGYQRESDFKLYCTVSATKVNSQGLKFDCDLDEDKLFERDGAGKVVAVWDGSVLRRRLLEKHSETFWIKARSLYIDGVEHFELLSATHTRGPLSVQLMELIRSGVITMDHLIKRTGGLSPKVSEKGPLFKINKRDLTLLFPEPQTYSLR